MFLSIPGLSGECPVEIQISGEQLVQITNRGNKSCSLEETAYIGLFWFKWDETKGNCTEVHFSQERTDSVWNKRTDKVGALSAGKLRQPGRLNTWAKCLLLNIALKQLCWDEQEEQKGHCCCSSPVRKRKVKSNRDALEKRPSKPWTLTPLASTDVMGNLQEILHIPILLCCRQDRQNTGWHRTTKT